MASFFFASGKHNYNTLCFKKDQLHMLSYNAAAYRKYSIKRNAMVSSNDMQNQFKKLVLTTFSTKNNLITPDWNLSQWLLIKLFKDF